MNTIVRKETKSEEFEMPKESGRQTKKVEHVLGLAQIYKDSFNNTLLRVTSLSDPSKEEIIVRLNEYPNGLRSPHNLLKVLLIFGRIKEEMGITKIHIQLCATSGNIPSCRVYAGYGTLRQRIGIEVGCVIEGGHCSLL